MIWPLDFLMYPGQRFMEHLNVIYDVSLDIVLGKQLHPQSDFLEGFLSRPNSPAIHFWNKNFRSTNLFISRLGAWFRSMSLHAEPLSIA
jgi:hypothetical protein